MIKTDQTKHHKKGTEKLVSNISFLEDKKKSVPIQPKENRLTHFTFKPTNIQYIEYPQTIYIYKKPLKCNLCLISFENFLIFIYLTISKLYLYLFIFKC